MRKIFYYLSTVVFVLFSLLIAGCSDDDADRYDANKVILLCPEHSDKEIVDKVVNIVGTVEYHDRYVIHGVSPLSPKQSMNTLVPCNLEEEFKEIGLQVEFSGYILELFDGMIIEDTAGHPFVITEIKFIVP